MDQQLNTLPKHVAVIMDDNGRWAKQRGLPRSEGHKEGAKTFRRIGWTCVWFHRDGDGGVWVAFGRCCDKEYNYC